MSSPASEDISKKKKSKRKSKIHSKDVIEETDVAPKSTEEDSNHHKTSKRDSKRHSKRHSKHKHHIENDPSEPKSPLESSIQKIEHLLDKTKKYDYNSPSDILIRVHSAKGIPAPTKGSSADFYWQFDMSVNLRHTSKSVILKNDDDSLIEMNAVWNEDVFIRRDTSKDSLLISLRSSALGYNASLGKVSISSLETLISNLSDNEIITDWFPLELNFKSADPNIKYNVQINLSFLRLPTVKVKNDRSSILSSPFKRNVSVIPNPYGSYPGSTIDCIVVLDVQHGGDKIETDDFLISVESDHAAFVEGKLTKKTQKRKSLIFQPDPEALHVSFTCIKAIISEDGIKIDDRNGTKRKSSIFSLLRSPTNVSFTQPGTYLWKVNLPLPGVSHVIHTDPDHEEMPSTTLPPSFKFGIHNVWEPIKKSNTINTNGSGETRHRIKVGYTNNETISEFNVLPIHRLDAPQCIEMKFQSPFNKEHLFVLKSEFYGESLNGTWTFKGSIDRDGDGTSIEEVSFELSTLVSFKNAGDGAISVPFKSVFKKDSDSLLKETQKQVVFNREFDASFPGYTMDTPLWSIEYYLVPTITFKNEGETKKKELNGISIGIYPTIGNTISNEDFELLSSQKLNKSMLLSKKIETEGYVVFPNMFYHPDLKELKDVPDEDKSKIFNRETGKQVHIKSFFSGNYKIPKGRDWKEKRKSKKRGSKIISE